MNIPIEVASIPITQPPRLHFHLLGSLQIERDSVRIHLPRRKVESLLVYLLLHPERHSRDHLATLFWGDSSDAQARHSLRTALATVRQQVSADLLFTDRDPVQLIQIIPCGRILTSCWRWKRNLTLPIPRLPTGTFSKYTWGFGKASCWQESMRNG